MERLLSQLLTLYSFMTDPVLRGMASKPLYDTACIEDVAIISAASSLQNNQRLHDDGSHDLPREKREMIESSVQESTLSMK